MYTEGLAGAFVQDTKNWPRLQGSFLELPGVRKKIWSFLCTYLIMGRSVLHTLLRESLDSGV